MHPLHQQLIKLAQRWALRQPFDAGQAAALRTQAILANHRHYRQSIPAYTRLAAEAGIGDDPTIEQISQHLMATDDLFKSYQPRWLDNGDFASMTDWLGQIHHQRPAVATSDIHDIDTWVERLDQAGIKLVYSSGTSGVFSFVPRDAANLALLRTANTCYVLPLLLHDKLGSPWQRRLLRTAAQFVSPTSFEYLARRASPRGFDSLLLDFRGGRTGMQAIGQELAPVFERRTFLYDFDLSASALRRLARGPQTDEDRALLARLHAETVANKERNFARVLDSLRRSTDQGRRVFVFGTPFQLKELCSYIASSGRSAALRPGSLVLFGGGWKSFAGEAIAREALVALIGEHLGLPPERIVEAYSMTEMNVLTLRCDYGRFHIPPIVEPLVFDEALLPLAGDDLRGVFGFLDPLAVSYPGFIITGDEVRLVHATCDCGLTGAAITEIGRARNREIKGCGGVMAAVRA